MCMMVYIASDHPLPTSAWDQGEPRFHVTELAERDVAVRCQFTKAHVYYVGSHQGCGCGFQYGQYPYVETDQAELAAAQESRRLLAEYLSMALKQQLAVEMFACWDGDQGTPPEHRSHVQPIDLVCERTFFQEKELLIVSAASVYEQQ